MQGEGEITLGKKHTSIDEAKDRVSDCSTDLHVSAEEMGGWGRVGLREQWVH